MGPPFSLSPFALPLIYALPMNSQPRGGPWRSSSRDRPSPDAPPMAGVRVLDISTALASPMASGILADQGADVIKLEPPAPGDVIRHIGPAVGGISGLYQMANRSKRAATVDFRSEEGRRLVLTLAEEADLVFMNFRPSVAERLRLRPEDLRAVNPEVIVIWVTGFGLDGPYASRPAYDGIIQAMSGFAALEADEETGRPHNLRHTVSDKLAALYAVQAATAALLARERGAGGQTVEVSMLEVSTAFLWMDAAGRETLLDYEGSQRSDPGAHVKPLPTSDGWIYIVALTDGQFAALCRSLEVPLGEEISTMGGRHRNKKAAGEAWREIRRRLAVMSTDDARRLLDAGDVPNSPAVPLRNLPEDPQLAQRDFFLETDDPTAGRMRQAALPVRFHGTPAVLGVSAPPPGRDTDAILAEMDGFDPEALRSAGVVG